MGKAPSQQVIEAIESSGVVCTICLTPEGDLLIVFPRKIKLYEAYLLSDEWREKRQRALELAGHRCQRCGSPLCLEVQHKTYESIGREWIHDLEVLCDDCREERHGRDKGASA